MPKIKSGFPGGRFVVVPPPFQELVKEDSLTNDLYIHSLGHASDLRHRHVARPTGDENHLFLWCTRGKGDVEFAEEKMPLHAGQFVVIPANQPFTCASHHTKPWTIYWILFSGSKANIFANQMGTPAIMSSIHSQIDACMELFKSMYSMLCKGCSIEKLNFANIQLAHFLAKFLFSEHLDEPVRKSNFADGIVSRVTHFMNENIETTLTIKQLASYAGYSPSYFYRRFIKETGHAPIAYFIRMKINKATFYLIKSSMSIAQISTKLGFDSPYYFSRTFRRVVGISPSEFRKQNFKL